MPQPSDKRDHLLARIGLGICLIATLLGLWVQIVVLTHAGALWRDEVNVVQLVNSTDPNLKWWPAHDSFPVFFFALVRIWSALGLGATRWESTWNVVVPYAKVGIVGSIFLSLARALGETMAVTMVIGNDPKISSSLFAPGYSIAAVIANEFTEATGNLYVQALIELGLVLFLLTILINGVARLLILVTKGKGA